MGRTNGGIEPETLENYISWKISFHLNRLPASERIDEHIRISELSWSEVVNEFGQPFLNREQ